MRITVESSILEGYPDNLVAAKLKILEQNDLSLPYTVELTTEASFLLSKLMPLLRICLLREMENYFFDSQSVVTEMISVRNESEALSTVLRLLLNSPDSPERQWQLAQLRTCSDLLCAPATSIEPAHQPTPADAAKLGEFSAWLKSAGVEVKWAVTDFPSTGRGVQALASFEPGQLVIELPRRLLLSPEQARASTTVGAVFRQLDSLEDDVILLLFILYEKNVNPSSFWRLYFETLPVIRTPLLYDLSAVSLLEGTLLLEEIVSARQQLQELHDQLIPQLAAAFPKVFVPEKFTYEDFLWVCSCSCSVFLEHALNSSLFVVTALSTASFLPPSLPTYRFAHLSWGLAIMKLFLAEPVRVRERTHRPAGPHCLPTFPSYLPELTYLPF